MEKVSKKSDTVGFTPESYFAQSKHHGQSRFILTIGIPGSGKSHWTQIAHAKGFVILNADRERQLHLEGLRSEGKSLTLGGQELKPDPLSSKQVFSKEMRDWGFHCVVRKLKACLKKDQSVIVDMTNVTLGRVPLMAFAGRKNYHVEALIFESSDPHINLQNINLRVRQSGLDLAPEGLESEEADKHRLTVIKDLWSQQKLFSSSIRVDPCFCNWEDWPERLNAEIFQSKAKDLRQYLEELSGEARALVERLVAQDVFHRVERVVVQVWG